MKEELTFESLPFVLVEKSEHRTALWLQAPHFERFHKAVMQAHSISYIDLKTKDQLEEQHRLHTPWKGWTQKEMYPSLRVCVEIDLWQNDL